MFFGGLEGICTPEWRFCRPLPYYLATRPYYNKELSILFFKISFC